MKKIIIIITAALPVWLFGQTAERQVIGSTGSSATTSTVQVSSTVGEVVTATGTSATIILSQGFQQADGGTVGIEDVSSGLSIKAYPNPSRGQVTLQIDAPNHTELTLSVYTVSGQLTSVPVQNVQINGPFTQNIDFSAQAAGNYYLQLTNSTGSIKQTIRIQKVD